MTINKIIEVTNLNYCIKRDVILRNVNFVIPQGKICALLGKNGAGKSTIIKCILHLIGNYSGEIQLDGVSAKLNKSRANVAYIPEKEDLGQARIKDFLIQQASYAGVTREESLERIKTLCAVLDFPFKNISRRTNMLSSGLKKIIIIMQALICNPKLVIADEPTANLDFETRIYFYKYIKKLNAQGVTFLISSHNLFEIEKFANYYVEIEHGKITNVGSKHSKHTLL